MSATATKTRKQHDISRTERLPKGWTWYDNMSVINPDGVIVYLTSGLRAEQDIARAIAKVIEDRSTAALRQKNQIA